MAKRAQPSRCSSCSGSTPVSWCTDQCLGTANPLAGTTPTDRRGSSAAAACPGADHQLGVGGDHPRQPLQWYSRSKAWKAQRRSQLRLPSGNRIDGSCRASAREGIGAAPLINRCHQRVVTESANVAKIEARIGFPINRCHQRVVTTAASGGVGGGAAAKFPINRCHQRVVTALVFAAFPPHT